MIIIDNTILTSRKKSEKVFLTVGKKLNLIFSFGIESTAGETVQGPSSRCTKKVDGIFSDLG